MAIGGGGGLFRRPLLSVRRATLRAWLTERGIPWVEDPSNDDTRFDRVKARQMLEVLAPLGLTVGRLNDTVAHMARARVTLWRAAAAWAAQFVRPEGGDLIFAPEALALGRSDVEARIFAAAVQWIGGADYRPRYEALTNAASALRREETRTLGGVLMLPDGQGGARLTREAAAVQGPVPVSAGPGKVTLWDGRWRVSQMPPATTRSAPDPGPGPWRIAALGEAGLPACIGWRDCGLPMPALLTSPAVWTGTALVAAPHAGMANGWQAELGLTFQSFILSH
jgi:tRNA(Ile)-lysidine synthase